MRNTPRPLGFSRFSSGGVGDVVEVESRALICHTELEDGSFRFHFDVDHLAGIQFVAVNNCVVDGFGHRDEDFL